MFFYAIAWSLAIATPADVPRTIDSATAVQFIIEKLEYDARYFDGVLKAQASGRTVPGLKPDEMTAEVTRARRLLPVLRRFADERAGYLEKGAMVTLPPASAEVAFREYTNLLAMLNMERATALADHSGVLQWGARVAVGGKNDLGRVSVGRKGISADDASRYYVALYRRYFFMMASAHFGRGDDAQALAWFAKLEGERDLVALKSTMAAAATVEDKRLRRLEELRMKPLAVAPFDVPAAGPGAEQAWMRAAVPDVLITDLAQATSLIVVERAQLTAVADELALALSGFTEGRDVAKAAQLARAASLVVGSVTTAPASAPASGSEAGKPVAVTRQVMLALRLVDGEDSSVLEAVQRVIAEDDVVIGARSLLVELLGRVGWDDGLAGDAVLSRHAPPAEALRSIHRAKLALASASDSAKARQLYADAIRADPALSAVYQELRAQFSDVSATVAVLPFANLSGLDADVWRARAVVEALGSDLPKLGFTVVERARLGEAIDATAPSGGAAPGAGAIASGFVDNAAAARLGGALRADFVVLGSVLRQAPRLRVDARFVEVRTGTIVWSTTVESDTDDLPGALAQLSREIGGRFSGVDEGTLDELVGRKLGKEELERFAKAALAKDALAKRAPSHGNVSGGTQPVSPLASFPWLAASGIGAVVAGAGIAGGGFVIGTNLANRAQLLHGAQALASGASRDELRAERDAAAVGANAGVIVGWTGVAIGALGAGALAWAAFDNVEPGEEVHGVALKASGAGKPAPGHPF